MEVIECSVTPVIVNNNYIITNNEILCTNDEGKLNLLINFNFILIDIQNLGQNVMIPLDDAMKKILELPLSDDINALNILKRQTR